MQAGPWALDDELHDVAHDPGHDAGRHRAQRRAAILDPPQREHPEQAVDERRAAVGDGGLERVQTGAQARLVGVLVCPAHEALLARQPFPHACAVPRLRRRTR